MEPHRLLKSSSKSPQDSCFACQPSSCGPSFPVPNSLAVCQRHFSSALIHYSENALLNHLGCPPDPSVTSIHIHRSQEINYCSQARELMPPTAAGLNQNATLFNPYKGDACQGKPPSVPLSTTLPTLEGQTRQTTDDLIRHSQRAAQNSLLALRKAHERFAAQEHGIVHPPGIGSHQSLSMHHPTLPPIIDLFYSMARDSIQVSQIDETGDNKKRRFSKGTRRRWSDEETENLIKGVRKHGVGKWRVILNDKEFKFENRTATNLKDRFRTCYPDGFLPHAPAVEYSTSNSEEEKGPTASQDEESGETNKLGEIDAVSPTSMSGAGIYPSPRKLERRKRQPFEARHDSEILDGLRRHGPAWTKIQRNSTSDLSYRRPTDLRDRIRNRFPDLYKRLEKKNTVRGGRRL
ncbi:hypothetical protein B0I35DRAFT_426566 [Stachybotrys elegans]|uniref:Myb-like domain-containing protein n=1 Tax=Stachybotrys elegans TaxID=80388 RepID=A0A8K0WTH9_9HYPO|nr:hypothetical protein B0I35DRAFT_426566 [Stachybotrys elegans]